jgi:pSer/pThr/pTyr-binding forkhead associated (FHA) protein
LIDLDARPSDRANVVGRSANSEVEIPSPEIAGAHCFLYVDKGRWAVQDAGSAAGTYVKGKRLTGPWFLESGDVIRLGATSNAPTLEVDPHHLGMTHEIDEGAPAASQANQNQPAPWSIPAPTLPPPPTVRQPAMPSGYAMPGATAALGEVPQTDQTDAWANVPATSRYYVPKPKHSSSGTIAVVVVLSLGIAGGAGYWFYSLYQARVKQPEVTVVNVKPKEVAKPSSMFDFSKEAARAREATRAAATRRTGATTAQVAQSDATQPVDDPRMQDPEWRAIELARYDDPALSIVKFDDYLDRFPNTPYKKDIAQYTDDALDRIWWQRLVELFHERDSAMKEIADRKLQISQSQDAAFKKQLTDEIAHFAENRDRAEDTINNQMKFKGQSPPNLYDSQDLEINRRQRDAAYYDTWKAQVLSAIRHSRGQRLPWRALH